MVVDDFNVFWAGCCPDEAEPELVVDADAVLAMAVSPKRLQAIAWWDLKIVQASGGIKDGELAEGHASEASKTPNRLPLKQGPGVAAAKRPDHLTNLPPLYVGTQHGGNRRGLGSPRLPCLRDGDQRLITGHNPLSRESRESEVAGSQVQPWLQQQAAHDLTALSGAQQIGERHWRIDL